MIPILVLLLTLGWSSTLLAQTPFYQGKTISILVGTKAGDVYDLYPRLLAEFLPKYIPGNPNIIIQNVPGAASLIAANQLYNVAKPDGLSLGAIYPALYFDQLVKKPEVEISTGTGSRGSAAPSSSNHMMYMRTDTPYKTIDDVRTAATPPKCGTSGVTSTGYYIPKLLEEAIGAKFDIVTGYQARPRCRSRRRARRGRMPVLYHHGISRPRALFHLAQESFCSRALSNRHQTRRAAQRSCRRCTS